MSITIYYRNSQCICNYVLKVRRAYQSKIDSYLSTVNTIDYNGQSYTVSRTESGPATTLVVKQGGDVCVTVDVVACVNGRVLAPRFVHFIAVNVFYSKSKALRS